LKGNIGDCDKSSNAPRSLTGFSSIAVADTQLIDTARSSVFRAGSSTIAATLWKSLTGRRPALHDLLHVVVTRLLGRRRAGLPGRIDYGAPVSADAGALFIRVMAKKAALDRLDEGSKVPVGRRRGQNRR
jgi:hypothetical protein